MNHCLIAEPTACPHCKALDDKVFTLKEIAIGENAPPLHPNCRCSTAAYAESDEEYDKWFYETTGKHSAQWEIDHGLKPSGVEQDNENDTHIQSGAMYGAYNNKNDPNYSKRNKIAQELCSEIMNRKRKYEIKAVSQNSKFSFNEIDRVYKHLFERKHLFKNGMIKLFDPDYYMMHSWLRLREGKTIFKHDLIMLHHELEEEKIMGDSLEIIYEKAHNEVVKKWNYEKALREHLKNHDV